MTRSLRNLLSGALLGGGVLCASAGWAEVTPDQLFQAWVDAAPALGGQLTARAVARGDRLVLDDLTLTAPTGARLKLGTVTLQRGAAGGVDILLPDRFEVTLDARPDRPQPGPKRLVFLVAAPEFVGHVRGIGPGDAGYTLTAPSLSVTLDRVQPAPPAPQHVGLTLALADLALDWQQAQTTAGAGATGRLTLGTLHGDFSYLLTDGPDPAGAGALALDVSDLAIGLEAFLTPAMAGPHPPDLGQDFAAFVAEAGAGLLIDLRGDATALALSGQITPTGKVEVTFAADGADAGGMVRLAEARMDHASWLGPGSLSIGLRDPGVPGWQYGLAWQDYRSGFGASFADPTADSPWNLLFRLSGLSLSPELWADLDPQGALPRDPASVVLDLAGLYALDPVVLTPGWAPAPGEALPMRSLTFELNQFLLDALGADLAATGGISLDFSATTGPGAQPGAAPKTTGRMDILTRGATGLVDRLGRTGLVGDSEISSLRFLLLMLGRAGAQPDTLETTLEFRGGHTILNGQRLD